MWCVLRAVADVYGLTTDPLDERGYKGPWYQAEGSLADAARLLYHGVGMTQREINERIAPGSTALRNTRPHVALSDYELELLLDAEALHGGALTD